jgi:hypothetical protein
MEEDANFKEEILVKNYIDYEILTNNFFLPITSLMSLYLFYQKANDNLMTKWYMCFTPLNFFFAYKFAYFLYKIVKPDENNIYNIIRTKLVRFENISNLSNFFSLLLYSGFIVLFYYIGLFLDTKKDEHIFTSIYIGFGLISMQLIYSFLRTLPPFSIMKHVISYKKDDDEEVEQSSYAAFCSTIMGPVLTYFSNMMIVCSTNTGMCTQIYMSTVASLLGAFGVSVSYFSEYLFPITVVLLGVSLISLYIKRRSLKHKPFLLGCLATILIIVPHYFESLWVLSYIGNGLMFGAAIWNMKVNKLSGLPRFK